MGGYFSNLLGTTKRCVTGLAISLTGIGRTPDLLENIAFIENEFQSFDDVLTLRLIRRLRCTLRPIDFHKIVVVETATRVVHGLTARRSVQQPVPLRPDPEPVRH